MRAKPRTLRQSTLLMAWERTVLLHGRRRAVVQAADGTEATFRELDARATTWLIRHAPEPTDLRGRVVVFALPNGIAWFEIFLALLKAGAVLMPLDAAEPPAAQLRLARALRAGFLWTGTKLEPLAGAKRYRDPSVCLLKLTSGSTGRPRALAFSAGPLLADARQVAATMGITRRDLNYALIPLGHSYGLGNLTLPLLAQGVSLVCGSSPLPHAIAADFARWRPTVFPGVPAMWRALAASDLTLPGMRLGISAGAMLPPEVAQDFAQRFSRRLHNFYGSSETGGISYDRTGAGALAGHVGTALRGVTLRAMPGTRLRVSSAAVLTQSQRRRIGKHGTFLMPDRVAIGPREEITLLGRCGHIVKIAGRRVNLAEVSERLRRIPGVTEVWVGVSPGNDPVLGAVVATARSAAELRAVLGTDTAAWKIPRKMVILPSLPLTARGKMDTRMLQAMLASG